MGPVATIVDRVGLRGNNTIQRLAGWAEGRR